MNYEQEIKALKEKIADHEAQIQGLPGLVMEKVGNAFASIPRPSRFCDNLQEPQE